MLDKEWTQERDTKPKQNRKKERKRRKIEMVFFLIIPDDSPRGVTENGRMVGGQRALTLASLLHQSFPGGNTGDRLDLYSLFSSHSLSLSLVFCVDSLGIIDMKAVC